MNLRDGSVLTLVTAMSLFTESILHGAPSLFGATSEVDVLFL